MRYFFLFLLVIALSTCQRKTTPTTPTVYAPPVSTPTVATGPTPAPAIPAKKQQAKNIILLIGDGMGLTQVSTTYVFGNETPSFSRFKYIGLHENRPIGKIITDSASGATAFSTGYKSYNSAIGVDKDTIPRETILEWAAKQNKATGVISTSSITHATPASFFAHVAKRSQQEDIALDFLEAQVDFTAGGGTKWFNEREDKRDLLAELEARGTRVSTKALNENPELGKQHLYLLAPDGMKKMSEGRGDFLPQATATAINFLANDTDGFFLLVEGSQIDWGGHNNDGDYVIQETLDFDQAIGKALDFAERDGNTLVVVTADHETGGLSLSAPEVFGLRDYGAVKPTFSTGGHSAALIPVFAYGPGAEEFMGIYQNNDIYGKMMAAFGQR